jgi:hypothetical protein
MIGMSVGWKTKHRLLEHFEVKYGSRSSQTMSWGRTKVDGHHDDLKKNFFINYKEFFHTQMVRLSNNFWLD